MWNRYIVVSQLRRNWYLLESRIGELTVKIWRVSIGGFDTLPAVILVLHVSTISYFPFLYFKGQFGKIDFSVSVFIGFMIATFTSILDSIGDYYACASMCRTPPPPSHAVNRGIAIEGFCSALAGVLGCGHATTTYGGNIGAIGVTRVRSMLVLAFKTLNRFLNIKYFGFYSDAACQKASISTSMLRSLARSIWVLFSEVYSIHLHW